MTDPSPELIAKAASAVRHERAYIAAAAFGVPLDDVGECAGMIAHAVLSAVADDLRAEALEDAADELHRLDDGRTGGYYSAGRHIIARLRNRAAKMRGATS